MRKPLALLLVIITMFTALATSAQARTYSLCDGPGATYGVGAAACAMCIARAIWNDDISICFGSALTTGGEPSSSLTAVGAKQRYEMPRLNPVADDVGAASQKK